MNRNLITLFVVIAAALMLARIALYGPGPGRPTIEPPEELESILLPEARPLTDFSLSDHNGQPLGIEQLKGKWHLLFFGYTHCPDICPTTLGMLKGVANKLQSQPELAADTRFLFISVDPKRDTLPHLREYIQFFDKGFLAATGQRKEIDTLARQLGAIYMFEGDTSRDDYIVNHTASVLLIDPQARWVARFNPPHTASKFSNDYQQLRNFLTKTTPQD